jgi:hypothetical protein
VVTVVAELANAGRTAEAAFARVAVEVHPEDYYERLYERRLAKQLAPGSTSGGSRSSWPPARRALYAEALAKTKRAHYVAIQRDIPIARDGIRVAPSAPMSVLAINVPPDPPDPGSPT